MYLPSSFEYDVFSLLFTVRPMYWPLVFLFVILLSATQVYSVTHDKSFSEGTCRYDLISLTSHGTHHQPRAAKHYYMLLMSYLLAVRAENVVYAVS